MTANGGINQIQNFTPLHRVALYDALASARVQAVATEGSFTAGARKLRVSQPTATNQVKQIEGATRSSCFTAPRTACMTTTGEELLAIVRRVFGDFDEALAYLQEAQGRRGGSGSGATARTTSFPWSRATGSTVRPSPSPSSSPIRATWRNALLHYRSRRRGARTRHLPSGIPGVALQHAGAGRAGAAFRRMGWAPIDPRSRNSASTR